LRLANADVLPFDFASYAHNVRGFVDDLKRGKDMSHLDLKPILDGIGQFESAGRNLDQSVSKVLASGKLNPRAVQKLNQGMMLVERNWLNPEGIPGRPWFKHILYGARFSYAHLELPGLTEAVEKGDWKTARQQADILHRALALNTQLIEQLKREITP